MSTRLGGYALEFLVGNLLTSAECCAMIGKHSTRAGQNKRKTGENEVNRSLWIQKVRRLADGGSGSSQRTKKFLKKVLDKRLSLC